MAEKIWTVGDVKKILNNYGDETPINIFVFGDEEYGDQFHKIDSIGKPIGEGLYEPEDKNYVSINVDVS